MFGFEIITRQAKTRKNIGGEGWRDRVARELRAEWDKSSKDIYAHTCVCINANTPTNKERKTQNTSTQTNTNSIIHTPVDVTDWLQSRRLLQNIVSG